MSKEERMGEDRQWVRLQLELRGTAARGLGPDDREEVLTENLETSPPPDGKRPSAVKTDR